MLIHREGLELARVAGEEGTEGMPASLAYVKVDPDGTVTATNGVIALRMQAEATEPSLFDELADPRAGADSEGGAVLVPADVMTALNAAMKKRKKGKKGMPEPHVIVRREGTTITLASSDGRTKRQFQLDDTAELEYPDVTKISKANKPVTFVTLDVDLLADVLKTLKAVKAEAITLGFSETKNAPISIEAFCEAGPLAGLLMPMAAKD